MYREVTSLKFSERRRRLVEVRQYLVKYRRRCSSRSATVPVQFPLMIARAVVRSRPLSFAVLAQLRRDIRGIFFTRLAPHCLKNIGEIHTVEWKGS